MKTFRRKSTEQEIKGTGQKVKGLVQEVVGRATNDEDVRAEGELNQVAGHLRSRAAEAGRKISESLDRDRPRRRR